MAKLLGTGGYRSAGQGGAFVRACLRAKTKPARRQARRQDCHVTIIFMAIATGITIEEFERLPDALAHNHELVDGELVDASGNTEYHNSLRDFLVELLRALVRERKLGKILSEQEYDFDGNAHGPDVSFIGAAKLHLIERKRPVQRFVHVLAIEIVSEDDKFKDPMEKALR